MLAPKVEVLRAHCADVGRDPSEITVSANAMFLETGCGDDRLAGVQPHAPAETSGFVGPLPVRVPAIPARAGGVLLDDLSSAPSAGVTGLG